MHPSVVVLDTETATSRGTPHLLELAAVHAVDGEVVDRFESLVCPQVPIDAEATAVHGIHEGMVRGAPFARDVLERFTSWLLAIDRDSPWLAAHNARFDAHVLAFEYKRAMLDLPPARLIDTLSLARAAFPDSPDHKLDTLCQVLDIDAPVRHRALPDAVSCWKVLEACVERLRPWPDAEVAPFATGDDAPRGEARGSEQRATPAARSWAAIASRGQGQTLASAAPRPARSSPRLHALEHACKTRAQVTLVYGEGDAPSHLSVAPRFTFRHDKKDYLEAECARSGLLKTYRLDRVHRVQVHAHA